VTTRFTRNRVAQGVRIANIMRRRQAKQDPVAAMLEEELDRAIKRAADALHASPRCYAGIS